MTESQRLAIALSSMTIGFGAVAYLMARGDTHDTHILGNPTEGFEFTDPETGITAPWKHIGFERPVKMLAPVSNFEEVLMRRYFGDVPPEWIDKTAPRREGKKYILYRIVSPEAWDFIQQEGAIFPHEKISSVPVEDGIVPVSGDLSYLMRIIKKDYYPEKDVIPLKIRVPPETKVTAWEGGWNIALPYRVSIDHIERLRGKALERELAKFR